MKRKQISKPETKTTKKKISDGEDDDPLAPAQTKTRYIPPNDNIVFVRMWNILVEQIKERENFSRYHLSQLEILCNLFQEYDELTKDIKQNGFSFTSVGRNGEQEKPRPEVGQRNMVQKEIREYSKILGINLMKETAHVKDGDPEKSEWEK